MAKKPTHKSTKPKPPEKLSAQAKGAKAKEEFHNEWSKFIHRVKVHELLRCLENEQKKLKILREHTDLNEILMGVGVPKPPPKPEGSDSTVPDTNLEEERTSAESFIKAESVGNVSASEAAKKLFKTKLEVTEEQFEQILQLCKDRVEQKQLRDAYNEKQYREKYLHNASERRRMLYDFINSKIFNRFLLLLIACSTIIIVMLTFEEHEIRYSFPLRICDAIIISIFLVEAGCKISIYKVDYFKNVWNILDLSIIITYFVEVCVELVTKILALSTNINKFTIFRFLKSMRSLRLLRTIKFMPNLQVIVSTIFESMISMSSIAILMAIIMIVFAVVGRGLFNDSDPRHFSSIFSSMLTLFQLLTLDDWFDLPDDLEAAETATANYYFFVIYLFVYILFEYFVFLNLFVAVLVDNFQLSLEEAQYGEENTAVNFSNAESIGLAAEEEKEIDASLGVENVSTGADLNVEDYYGLDPNCREMKLMAENLKTISAIDFEYFLFTRRLTLAGTVLDAAVATKQNTWTVQDAIDYRLSENPEEQNNSETQIEKKPDDKDKGI